MWSVLFLACKSPTPLATVVPTVVPVPTTPPSCVPTDEVCNEVDDDCDGEIDEGVALTFFQDGDGDGFGGEMQSACEIPFWGVPAGGDCDDSRVTVFPDATEVCNNLDDDCDGLVDSDDPNLEGGSSGWVDADGDGVGGSTAIRVCGSAPNVSLRTGDCDDADGSVFPGAVETVGDAVDSDCDGADDRAAFSFRNFTWERPGRPKIMANDLHFIVAAHADHAVSMDTILDTQLPEAAVWFSMERGQPDSSSSDLWANVNFANTDPIAGLDLVAEGESFHLAYTQVSSGLLRTSLMRRDWTPTTGFYQDVQLVSEITPFDGHGSDTALTLEGGQIFVTACGGAGRTERLGEPQSGHAFLHPLVLPQGFTAAMPRTLNPTNAGVDLGALRTGDICWHEVTATTPTVALTMHSCDVESCAAYDVSEDASGGTATVTPASSPWPSGGPLEVDTRDGLRIVVDPDGVRVTRLDDADDWLAFVDQPVLSADAVIQGDELFVAVVLAGSPNTVMTSVQPLDGSTLPVETVLPFEDPNPIFRGGVGCVPATGVACATGRTLDPRWVSLEVTEDHIGVAVSAWTPEGWVPAEPGFQADVYAQDAVGWMFLAR